MEQQQQGSPRGPPPVVSLHPQRVMADPTPLRTPPKVLCPRCGEVTAWTGNPFRPFCSERCKMIDLGAWASEDYKIPGKRLEPEEIIAEGIADDGRADGNDGKGGE